MEGKGYALSSGKQCGVMTGYAVVRPSWLNSLVRKADYSIALWATQSVALLERKCATVKNAPEKAQQPYKFYFVPCSVSTDIWPDIEALYPTADTVFDFLVSTLSEGLKVQFAYNASNQLIVCSISDRREGSPTLGACLTGGAPNWYDSLRVVAYKYTALLHGELSADDNREGGPPRIV